MLCKSLKDNRIKSVNVILWTKTNALSELERLSGVSTDYIFKNKPLPYMLI